MAVALAGPYSSRSYVIGRQLLLTVKEGCPSFCFQLIPLETDRWQYWLKMKCEQENWRYEKLKKQKVLTWKELGYPGGPKVLLGGLPPFMEYLKDKYGVSRKMTKDDVDRLVEKSKAKWESEEEKEAATKGFGGNISIVGAASNEATCFLLYSLMTIKTPAIITGIKVKLYDAGDGKEKKLEEILNTMSLVESHINISIVDQFGDVLKNCDVVIFLGDKFRKPGMDIEKFLYSEKVLYGTYGFLCNHNMEKETKVMFTCMENATFNAQCFLAQAPDIDKNKVVAVTSYLGTELKLYISKLAGFPPESIDHIPVWGMADTCHLVDLEKGCLLFRVPDMENPKWLDIKAVANLVEDEDVRKQLLNAWKMKENVRVSHWKWCKIIKKIQKEDKEEKKKNERLALLSAMAEDLRKVQRKTGQRQYWERWDQLIKETLDQNDYYSCENMFKRFKKGLHCVVYDRNYMEKREIMKKDKKMDEYINLCERAGALKDSLDSKGKGLIELEAIKKMLQEEMPKQEEEEDTDTDDEIYEELEDTAADMEIEMLTKILNEKQEKLKTKIHAYWKRFMEEQIQRLEDELRKKALLKNQIPEEEGILEGLSEEEATIMKKTQSGTVEKSELELEKSQKSNTEKMEIEIQPERELFEHGEETEAVIISGITVDEKEELNEMIKEYYKLKMKLERKVNEDVKFDDSQDEFNYDEMDEYEARDLDYITGSMNNLWNFIGVCKTAVRRKLGQDPFMAQVSESIKVLRIWFLDPFMKNETIFLGVSSDYEAFPFLKDTVMSQIAYCDEDMRWHPMKEAKSLWPQTPEEKIPDVPQKPVPIFRTPKEGLPFTIKYVIGTSLECLMHFQIPPASYFQIQRDLQEHANRKEYFEMIFTMADIDKQQMRDLMRRMGEDIESTDEELFEEEGDKEEATVEEEFIEKEFEMEEGLWEGPEEMGEQEYKFEEAGEEGEEYEQLISEVPSKETTKRREESFTKQNSKEIERVKELDKLGEEELGKGFDLEDEGGEEMKSMEEDLEEEEQEEDILNFIEPYGEDMTLGEFLKVFEKLEKKEDIDEVEEENKPEKRKKKSKNSFWLKYLNKFGFNKLNVQELNVMTDNKMEDNKTEKDEAQEAKYAEEIEEGISKDFFEEEVEQSLEEENKSLEEEEEDLNLLRGVGFIENMECDFSTRDLIDLPYDNRLKPSIPFYISKKPIEEHHIRKVGYPLHKKGKSTLNFSLTINKLDFGKKREHEDNGDSVAYTRLTFPEKSITNPRPSDMPEQRTLTPTIIKVFLPEGDSYEDSEELFIPSDDLSTQINTEEEIKEEEEEEELLIQVPAKQKVKEIENEGVLKLHQKETPQPGVEEDIKLRATMGQVHVFIEKEVTTPVPEPKIPVDTKKKEKPNEKIDKEEEEMARLQWENDFDKIKRIMYLEKISGKSFLHIDLANNEERLRSHNVRKRGKEFAQWVNSVIKEQETIRKSCGIKEDDIKPKRDTWNISKLGEYRLTEFPDIKEKTTGHHEWLNGMIEQILMLEQLSDLENLAEAVKNSDEDEIRVTVSKLAQNREDDDDPFSSQLKEIVGKDNVSQVYDVNENESAAQEEQTKESRCEWMLKMPQEEEEILKEIIKSEKEITKDCHNIKDYVKKCRENTKLFSLYRGDAPIEWKFLEREPGESREEFKCKALQHASMTMNELEEKYLKKLEEAEQEDFDFTELLSDGHYVEPDIAYSRDMI